MVINYKRIFILIILLFLGFTDVRSASAYKNELTKVSLSPIGSSDVKVTLYMAKPYSEPLRLLKKNDGEFVLILPETYTSAPQKPSIADVIGEVTDADIKLYSFVSNVNQNGYTKIVIKTNGLVNVYPEAVTTGGGTLVNHPQYQINKIVTEKLKPAVQPQNNSTPQEPKKIADNKVQTKPSETVKNNDKKPEAKVLEPAKNDNLKSKQTEVVKKAETKNEEVVKQEEKNTIEPEPKKDDTKTALSKIETEISAEPTIEPVEEKTVEKPVVNKNKNNILSRVKHLIISKLPDTKGETNQSGNIFVTLISLMLFAFSVKFAISVIKNSGQQQENTLNEKENEGKGYSNFFKTLIEAETQNKPAYSILPQQRELSGVDIIPNKSHKEVMNEDQNLTWQEKFRVIQKNRKSLLQDEEPSFNIREVYETENTENMNFENPIKKLKRDFRAVRKVLEKQAAKNGDQSIKQDFTPEKIEKIEVISFEDLQKHVQQPKVQVNKTVPIKPKAPKILTRLKLADNKGFYLVDYKGKISLMGYVEDKIFKLNSYSSVKNPKLYARLTEKTDVADTYIVKIDSSKLLVDVNNENMKLKLMY